MRTRQKQYSNSTMNNNSGPSKSKNYEMNENCEKESVSMKGLKKSKAPVTCSICNKNFSHKGNLKVHNESVHKGNKFQCDKCPYSTGQKGSLMTHQLALHGGRVLVCDVCGKRFKWPADLRRHKIGHNQFFECDVCYKQFAEKRSRDSHKRSAHEKIKKRCDYPGCDFESGYSSGISAHKKIVHENVVFKCQICEYETKRKGDYSRHTAEKHFGSQFLCTLCNFSSKRSYRFKEHKKTQHVSCDSCNFVSANSQDFEVHRRKGSCRSGCTNKNKDGEKNDNETEINFDPDQKSSVKSEPMDFDFEEENFELDAFLREIKNEVKSESINTHIEEYFEEGYRGDIETKAEEYVKDEIEF